MSSNSSPSSEGTVEPDCVVSLGDEQSNTSKLFAKLGFRTRVKSSEAAFKASFSEQAPDILLIDTAFTETPEDLVSFVRAFDLTKEVPIVVFSSTGTVSDYSKEYTRLETVFSNNPGLVAGKVATTLRLAKMRGDVSRGSSIHEKNLALRNSLKEYKREWEDAKTIQATLLATDYKSFTDLDISVKHTPLHDVGGDWYFVEKFSNNRTFISLCDVTGHGLSAAFLGSMTRLAMHAGRNEPLSDLMYKANNLLTPELPEGRFITAIASTYSSESKTFEIIRAGHPPALLFRKVAGGVEEIRPNGFALGFMEEAVFPSQSLSVESGDVVFFYSDGITEACNRFKEQFGMTRLKEIVVTAALLPTSEEITNLVNDSLNAFLDGRKMNDDLTLMAIKVR